jgi:hypothetical protein
VDRVVPDRHLQAEAPALACQLNQPLHTCLVLAISWRDAATLISACARWPRGFGPRVA